MCPGHNLDQFLDTYFFLGVYLGHTWTLDTIWTHLNNLPACRISKYLVPTEALIKFAEIFADNDEF